MGSPQAMGSPAPARSAHTTGPPQPVRVRSKQRPRCDSPQLSRVCCRNQWGRRPNGRRKPHGRRKPSRSYPHVCCLRAPACMAPAFAPMGCGAQWRHHEPRCGVFVGTGARVEWVGECIRGCGVILGRLGGAGQGLREGSYVSRVCSERVPVLAVVSAFVCACMCVYVRTRMCVYAHICACMLFVFDSDVPRPTPGSGRGGPVSVASQPIRERTSGA